MSGVLVPLQLSQSPEIRFGSVDRPMGRIVASPIRGILAQWRHHPVMQNRRKSYWIYSTGCAVVWAIILGVTAAVGSKDRFHSVLLVFVGFAIAWVSGTIARYVYPPPSRWLQSH
jgi:hypothetical protein